jgi:hypothetical protein
MPKTFRIGESVEWEGPRGKVRGKVKRKLTSRTKVRGKDVDASEENPQYLVAADDTGEETAQGPDSLEVVN